MKANKTDCALKIFLAEEKLNIRIYKEGNSVKNELFIAAAGAGKQLCLLKKLCYVKSPFL